MTSGRDDGAVTDAAPVPIRVSDGTAGDLPGADGEQFDAVVRLGLLCSVPDCPGGAGLNSAASCGPAASCVSTSTYAAATLSSPATSGPPTSSGRA